MKVIIEDVPNFKRGGGVLMNPQNLNGKEYPYYWPGNDWTPQEIDVRSSIPHAEPGTGSVEAEGGETVYVPDTGSGQPAHFDVTGPRHSSGGVDLSVPKDSFFFSDTRDMKIGGPILQTFGKSKDTKKKYTPADLAKKYDLNKFLKQAADPNSTDLQKKTAQLMIENYKKKLAQLALVQEAKKSFPNGIPEMAQPYLQSIGRPDEQEQPGDQDNEQRELQFGGQFMEDGGSYAWANSPTGGGFWQDGGQPRAVHPGEQWWENKTVGPGSPSEIGSNKLWHPFDQHESFLDWAGNALEYGPKRINQAIHGYYEYPSETMNRFHPGHPILGFINDFVSDPVNAVPISDVANLAGKGTVAAGKVLAKIPGIKRAVQYMAAQPWEFYGDMAKAYGHDAAAKIGKLLTTKSAGYIPSVLSQIHKHTPQTQPEQSQFPQLPPGGYSPENFVQRRDIIPTFSQPQIDSMFPSQNPINIDSIANSRGFKQFGGDLPQAQSGTQVEEKPDGRGNIVLWINGKPTTRTKPDPNFKGSSKGTKAFPQGITSWPGDRNDKSNKSAYSTKQWQQFRDAFCPECKTNEQLQQKILTNPRFAEDVKRLHDQYGMPVAGKMVDNKLGHRWDFVFNAKPKEAVGVEGYESPPIQPNDVTGYKRSTNAPWWLQDVVGTAGAAYDYLNLKKYLPWGAKATPYIPEPTFYDPTRALANNTEQMSIGTQGIDAYAGPQSFNSRFSEIQGKGAKNAADTLANYEERNVGLSNQFSGMRADVLNKADEYNANLATSLYDKNTIANQQFDNSKREAFTNLRDQYTNAITNRADAQRYNQLYPHFQVYPDTGGLGYNDGNPFPYISPISNSGPVKNFVDERIKEGMAPKDAWELGIKYYDPQGQYSDDRTRAQQEGQYPPRRGYR